MRSFPLEIVNSRPTPKRIIEAELPVAGALDPSAGWQVWQADPSAWPVTTLLALEAVQAAHVQGPEAGAQLARALRSALFAESRCVSMRHVIVELATTCDAIDTAEFEAALDDGTGRPALLQHIQEIRDGHVEVSPHVFLPGGSDVKNPGIDMHWEGEHGVGFPVVDRDDPSIYEELLREASG
jgi:predicted DsbA family dithiol-disulfide isomerase